MTEKEEKQLANYKKRVQKQNDYIREKYDRVSVTLPKGTKERIENSGLSINAFINNAIIEKLDKMGL